MKPSIALPLALLTLLAGAPLRAATPLNRLAGADTVLLVTVDDLGTLQKNWQQSPMGKTWNDPQMIKYLAPLRQALHVDEWDARCRAKTGKGVDELIAGFGSMVLTVGDMTTTLADESGKTAPPVLLAVDLRDNQEAVLKLIKDEKEKARQAEVTEEFQGETLHLEMQETDKKQDLSLCWVMLGRVMLLSKDKAPVQQAIADYKRGGAETPYVDTDRYREEVKRLPGAQIRVDFDLGHLMPAVLEAAARKAAKQKPNPLGVTPESVMKALGVDTLQNVSLGCEVGEKESTMVGGLTYGEPHGITKLLAASTEGPVPEPTFLSGDWASVSSGRVRFDLFFPMVEEIVHALGPAIDGMFQQQVLNLNKRSGIDLKRDFFGNLGDEFFNASRFEPSDSGTAGPAAKPRQLMVLSLNDPKAFEAAVQALLTGLLGPAEAKIMQTRDYLGATIHTFMKAGGPDTTPTPVFAYAVAQRYLVLGVGGADLVEMTIHNLNEPQPSYWQRPEVRAALSQLPEGATGYGYVDLHKLAPIYLDLFAQATAQSRMRIRDGKISFGPPPPPPHPPAPPPTPGGPEAPPPAAPEAPPPDPGTPVVNADAKPSADVIARYWGWMASGSYHDAHGTFSVLRLEHPQ